MNKEILVKYINDGKTLKEISIETKKSISSIRHWLKKYDLKTKRNKCYQNHLCVACGNQTQQGRKLCSLCSAKMTRLRQKISLIKYKGGVCEKCGCSDIEVLDFHHTQPSEKEFNLSSGIKNWKSKKNEADKCSLLCSNCHRKIHSSEYWKRLFKYAIDYKGNNSEMKEYLAP